MMDGFRWRHFLIIILFFSVGLALVFSSYYNTPEHIKKMKILLQQEYERHPEMEIQDLYKFVHQAVMGSEHAVNNSTDALDWMNKEISNLDFSIHNNMMDTLSANVSIVRVNLRPYIEAGFNTNKLVDAFVKTANNYKGSKETLNEYLIYAKELIKHEKLPFDLNEYEDFISLQKENGFPALHHSKTYIEKYKPAYRVIAAEYLAEILKK